MPPGSGQLTLAIDRAHEQTLENFVLGPNSEAFEALTRRVTEFAGFGSVVARVRARRTCYAL